MRAGRVDANQPDIVRQLRALPGVSVALTTRMGVGFPDIVVGWRSRNYLIEIKDPSKRESDRRLTSDQVIFHHEWNGQVDIAETFSDCLRIIGYDDQDHYGESP